MPVDISELKSKASGKTKALSVDEATVDELITKSRIQRFIERFQLKTRRGDGSIIDIGIGNEWKILELAQLFNYDIEILDRLEADSGEILNTTNPVELILGMEQIKLQRATNELLSTVVCKLTAMVGTPDQSSSDHNKSKLEVLKEKLNAASGFDKKRSPH